MKAKPVEIQFNRKWQGQHGMIYYHSIKFDNGEEGQFSSAKKDQNKFVIGQEVDYYVKSTTKNNTKMFDKEKEQSFGGSNKGSYNDPIANAKMAMSVCQSAACNMYINVKKQGKDSNIQLVANKFYEWVTKNSKDRNVLSLRWNALERSVSLIQIMKQDDIDELLKNNTLSNEIIIKSEFYMNHVDAITS